MRRALALALATVLACDSFAADTTDAGSDASARESGSPNVSMEAGPSDDPDAGDAGIDAAIDPATVHSCSDIHGLRPGAPSGVYDITSMNEAFPVYCDMETDGGGWTLVFRVSAGIPGDPLMLYQTQRLNEMERAEVTTAKTSGAYTNRLLQRWNLPDFQITQARGRVVGTDTSTLKDLVFDATGTEPGTFWAQSRILESPWADLDKTTDTVAFSVVGDPNEGKERRFFVEAPYGDCSTDKGWLVVHGPAPSSPCPWEKENVDANTIQIFVAKQNAAQVWHEGATLGAAFSILVR